MTEAKVPKTDSQPNQDAELTKEAISEEQEKPTNVDFDKDYEASQQYNTGNMSKDTEEEEEDNEVTPSL
ncbi:hypothetical protein IQ247_13115 [Plectonema cf. radiosum LEGE 06105]|uniref:Uncharacterized protein n=1 Tax=Plectonema cf. radiosum LEGE 06105 TaxID=945769 RepID=A0A8J7JUN1_9CYAN|nr:hypothetical protein [Plectonema radiosum]MBE9213595.1 hypothetical protein [Plectonema cf. radiosum LEGE 06105]